MNEKYPLTVKVIIGLICLGIGIILGAQVGFKQGVQSVTNNIVSNSTGNNSYTNNGNIRYDTYDEYQYDDVSVTEGEPTIIDFMRRPNDYMNYFIHLENVYVSFMDPEGGYVCHYQYGDEEYGILLLDPYGSLEYNLIGGDIISVDGIFVGLTSLGSPIINISFVE